MATHAVAQKNLQQALSRFWGWMRFMEASSWIRGGGKRDYRSNNFIRGKTHGLDGE